MTYITRQVALTKASGEKTETEAQQFNKLMNTGKKSSAVAELKDTPKGALSLGVPIVKGKAVEQALLRSTRHLNQLMLTILHQSQ